MYFHKNYNIKTYKLNHRIYDSRPPQLIRERPTTYFLTKVGNHLLYLMIKNNHGPVFILKTSIHEYEYEIEDILNGSILNPKIKMFL